MNQVPRNLDLTPEFVDCLAAIQEYEGQQNPVRGRKISSALLDFAFNTIGPFPQAYPRYAVEQYPDRDYRRAVYRREYVLIYRVTDAEVSFLLVYSTRQNPDSFSVTA